MTLPFILLALIALAVFGGTMWGLRRGLTSLLAQSFDRSDRLQDEKGQRLRMELLAQMESNRRELQVGLVQSTQVLENKITQIDRRTEERIQNFSQGVQGKLDQNLKDGFKQFEKVQTHLKLAEQQLASVNQVGQSINDLNNLLKMPHLRGNFGEAMLETLLADLLPAQCYELQFQIVPNSTERVDAVIKHPHAVLPIDSKFPREQILPLFENADAEKMDQARNDLYAVIRKQGLSIKEKYIRPEHGTTEMALLFVPSETLYFEIIRNIKLCGELSKLKVFPTSPNTLAITLQSISLARTYYEMAQGVENTIMDIKKARQHFSNFEKRFTDVGTSLGRAQNAYQMAGTHLSRYNSSVTRLAGVEDEVLLSVEPITPQLSEDSSC